MAPRARKRRRRFDPVRELLEDFEPLGGLALVRRRGNPALRTNVLAAVVASSRGYTSVDYARRRHAGLPPAANDSLSDCVDRYVDAYRAAKEHVFTGLSSFVSRESPEPSVGQFGASLVLERLPYSFLSAHLLYRLGHRYEGHAVARLILEQIAWAFVAYQHDEVENIASIVTTRTVSALNRLIPDAGRLYGFLSKKTHIDYDSHFDFLHIDRGRNAIYSAQPEFSEYARVVLMLADIFVAVWEVSQRGFIDEPRSICWDSDRPRLNAGRSFLTVMQTHQAAVDAAQSAFRSKRQRPARGRVGAG